MKSIAETIAPACTELHISALRRVARGAGMFETMTRDRLTLAERQRAAQDLRRWCLVDGKGEALHVTRIGHSVINKLEGK